MHWTLRQQTRETWDDCEKLHAFPHREIKGRGRAVRVQTALLSRFVWKSRPSWASSNYHKICKSLHADERKPATIADTFYRYRHWYVAYMYIKRYISYAGQLTSSPWIAIFMFYFRGPPTKPKEKIKKTFQFEPPSRGQVCACSTTKKSIKLRSRIYIIYIHIYLSSCVCYKYLLSGSSDDAPFGPLSTIFAQFGDS